jgi:hypothetical protein
VYDNTYYTPNGLSRFTVCQLRAGSGVFFDNTASGFIPSGSYGCQMEYEEKNMAISDTTWPGPWQTGSGINGYSAGHAVCGSLDSAPAYAWNNVNIIIYGVTYDSNNDELTPGLVQANRDFFTSGSQPSSMSWEEKSGDTCATTYTYKPYTYPHPLTLNQTLSDTPAAPTALTASVQ